MAEQELTGQVEGVGGGEETTGEVMAGVSEQPTAAGPGPAIADSLKATGPKKPVDLTEFDEFRRWQASRDRQEAQLRNELAQRDRQMQEVQQQLERVQLANADPEDVVAYYQKQYQAEVSKHAQSQQEQQLSQKVQSEAGRLLEEHGLDVNTPGLDWSGSATWEGYGKLAESVAKIEGLRAREQAKGKSAAASQAAQAAKAEALEQAGVTKVSTATGQATPKDLKAEFEAEKQKMRNSGDTAGYAQLKRKYLRLGLEV